MKIYSFPLILLLCFCLPLFASAEKSNFLDKIDDFSNAVISFEKNLRLEYPEFYEISWDSTRYHLSLLRASLQAYDYLLAKRELQRMGASEGMIAHSLGQLGNQEALQRATAATQARRDAKKEKFTRLENAIKTTTPTNVS